MADQTPTPPGVPQVTDRRRKIEGILPKNAQTRLLGAIALLMVVIIVFSGRNASKERPTTGPSPTAAASNVNQERIQTYRNQIEEQTRRLAAEEAQLAQTKGMTSDQAPRPNVSQLSAGRPVAVPESGFSRESDAENWMARDRQKREYQGLFASNVALSYRQGAPVTAPYTAAGPVTAPDSTESAHATAPRQEEARNDVAVGKKHRLFEGTVIETVLTNRLDASLSGPVNCMVTTDLYSHDHQRLLIPQGTRLLGEVRRIENMGEQRVAVFFHRMIMPDGFSVGLDKFQGLNQVGETGLRDVVNHHYLQVFGVSVAIGALAGLSQANTHFGADASSLDAYRQGVATSLAQSSMHILDKYLNVLPTFTIREGHRIKVYLSADLLVPAYDQHNLPSDL